MLVEAPIGKTGQVFEYPLAVRVKNMRTIRMDQHAILIFTVMCIAADMIPLIYDEHALPACRQPFGTDCTCKAGTYDKEVIFHRCAS